jgi:hypothetical protein
MELLFTWKRIGGLLLMKKRVILTTDPQNIKNVLKMNLLDMQTILEVYARDSNKDVRFYAKSALKVLNDEEVDMKSMTSTNTRSFKPTK